MKMRCVIIFPLTLLSSHGAFAADSAAILDIAERHLALQTQSLPGKVSISLSKFDGSRLPPCNAMEAFTPQGSRMMGKTTVGVRCHSPSSWSVLIAAQISVTGTYLNTSRALVAGQIIQQDDLTSTSGDISNLPPGIIGDPANAIGKTLRNSLGPGQMLRADQLLSPLVIRQGQTVRVVSTGEGFSASAEGKAISNAAIGQIVQVRMASGQTVSGIAKADGTIEISF